MESFFKWQLQPKFTTGCENHVQSKFAMKNPYKGMHRAN